MSIEKVELFRCGHCKEYHSYTEKDVNKHLKECVTNPDNKACLMCKHILRHNFIDEVTNKPAAIYTCEKRKQEINDYELTMLGAECFEERAEVKIPSKNTDQYTDYLEKTVIKIQETIK